ncbi:MAG TPA: DUF4382 domain-containing protein [Acidobacteriaceae bacterium]|jgi:hypothetical protein|nr:DUF4382 domain-containing protein [Acidobacteriaceae bacterium]
MTRILGAAGSFGLAAALVLGCSSSVTPGTVSNINASSSTVPVLITDAPSDQLVAFSLTLNTITLTDSAGQTASILPAPATIEICHLNGIQAPLVTASIPQDTYTSAVITFSSPQITYINSSGQPVSVTPTLATTSFTFTFPGSGFVVNNSSTSLLIDLLAGQSVAISGTTVTVTPVFSLKPVPPSAAAPPNSQNGTGMQQMATVVSVSGTSVTLQPASGADFTVTTNSSTMLQGPNFTSLSALTAGEIVQVNFIVESGGVYLATSIQIPPPPPNGQQSNMISGPVTSVSTGSFKMALMQGAGPSVGPSSTGDIVNVTTSSSTTYSISPQFVTLTGLPFTPSFTSSNLVAGQTVGVVTSAFSASAETATATTVYLAPQTVDGTVTAIATSGAYTAYTFSLASGSAFSSLSGASTITVYTGAATAPPPASTATGATAPPAITVGSTVRFNGLIFNLGSGSFAMVAGCSPDGPPGQ